MSKYLITHKSKIMKKQNKILFTTVLFLTISFSALAQYYDGSAYAYAEVYGRSICITVAFSRFDLNMDSKTAAKQDLEGRISRKVGYDDKMTSQIYYNINTYERDTYNYAFRDDAVYYGGTASVEVSDKNGKTRFINGSYPCNARSIGEAKKELLNTLYTSGSEEFIKPVRFDIDKCNK